MNTRSVILVFLAIVLISFASSSCGNNEVENPPIVSTTLPATPTENGVTITPELSPAITPTPLKLPLTLAGTPIQSPVSAISSDTVSLLDQLARWGKGTINQIAVSPGGDMVAVAASVGIYLYRLPSLDLIDFVETGIEEKCIVFSPDGKIISTGSGTGILVFWDVSHGNLAKISMIKSGSRINALSISPDGTQIAVATYGIFFRRVPDGELLTRITEPHEKMIVTGMAFSADGKSLYSGAHDGLLKEWNTADGSLEGMLLSGGSEINTLALSPDGNHLAVGFTDGSIQILDPSTASREISLDGHTGWVNSLAYSPDGSLLASGGYGDPIKIWRLSDGSLVRDMGENLVDVRTMAFLPDGTGLVSASDNGMLALWGTADGRVLASSGEHDFKVSSVVFSPDSVWLAAGLDSGFIQIRGFPLGVLEITDSGGGIHVTSVAFSPDGTRLAAGSWPFNIKLWSWSNEGLGTKIVSTINTPDGPPVAFTIDSKWLVTMYPGMLMFRDARNGGEHHFLSGDILGETTTFVFSSDGSVVALGTKDGRVYVFRVSDRVMMTTLDGPSSEVFSLAFAPAGNFLAGGYRDGSVQVWAIPSGVLVYRLTTLGPDYQCYSCETPVQFSPSGSLLMTGSVEGKIGIWDAPNGLLLATLNGHTGGVTSLAFSSDGVYLASGSEDGTVRIWGVTTK